MDDKIKNKIIDMTKAIFELGVKYGEAEKPTDQALEDELDMITKYLLAYVPHSLNNQLPKYEYSRVYIARNREELNELGSDGWEMCGFDGHYYYFKRRIL